MTRHTLVLADDHELVARGLATLLAPHHDIAAVVHSGGELLGCLGRLRVDCVLLDVSMPLQSGLDVLPELRRRWPELKILMLTMHADSVLAEAALGLGAAGYVPKDAALPAHRATGEDPAAAGRGALVRGGGAERLAPAWACPAQTCASCRWATLLLEPPKV